MGADSVDSICRAHPNTGQGTVEGTEEERNKVSEERLLTPNEAYSVRAIDPKYVAVKGSRGVDIKCCTMCVCVMVSKCLWHTISA